MVKSNTSTTTKAWFLFFVSTVGMFVFAGLYLFAPKVLTQRTTQVITNTVLETITNTAVMTITNTVAVEVPKEVEKIVKVPAEIPDEYVVGLDILKRMTNATPVTSERALFNMKDVRAVYLLQDSVKEILSEDEVRSKFELSLRRNNVPVNPNSPNVVVLGISGFFESGILCYNIQCSVAEWQFISRGGEMHSALIKIWERVGTFGTVGKSRANEALLGSVEKRAEVFANDFLSANPKPQQ